MKKGTQAALIALALNVPIALAVTAGLLLTRSPWCLLGLWLCPFDVKVE